MSQRATAAGLPLPVVSPHSRRVELVSIDAATNRYRVYTLAWQQTLWGEEVLVCAWGRLGSPHRSQLTLYPSPEQAEQELRTRVRRRLAHGYRLVEWD